MDTRGSRRRRAAGQGPDLATIPTFVIGGLPRSGRSTVLLTMVASLLRNGIPLVLVAPRRSLLREMPAPGVVDLIRRDVVDDAEQVLSCDAGSDLGEIARIGSEMGRGLVMAGTIDGLSAGFAGWHVYARRNRQGALLNPQNLGDGNW
jgi:S-DNA-T family DNA segregation ATPase FtsK/SpoIIIE